MSRDTKRLSERKSVFQRAVVSELTVLAFFSVEKEIARLISFKTPLKIIDINVFGITTKKRAPPHAIDVLLTRVGWMQVAAAGELFHVTSCLSKMADIARETRFIILERPWGCAKPNRNRL